MKIDAEKVRKLYFKIKFWLEKFWPFYCSLIIVSLFTYYYQRINDVNKIFDETMETSLSVSGTLIGFLLTIYTLMSTINTRRMKFVKSAGLYPRMNKYIMSAIVWNIVNISLILFYPTISSFPLEADWLRVLITVIVFTVIFSWTLSIRFTKIFLQLLKE